MLVPEAVAVGQYYLKNYLFIYFFFFIGKKQHEHSDLFLLLCSMEERKS